MATTLFPQHHQSDDLGELSLMAPILPPKHLRKLQSPIFPRKLQSQMTMAIRTRKTDKPHNLIAITSQTRTLSPMVAHKLQSQTMMAHNTNKPHKPITTTKIRTTIATATMEKTSKNTNIIYTGSDKLSMTRTALERCGRLPFNFEADLDTETSNTLAIKALAKLISPYMDQCANLRINIYDEALVLEFLDSLRRNKASNLRKLALFKGRDSGPPMAEHAISRISFLDNLPLQRLRLDGIDLSALEVVPDVISLSVMQIFTRSMYDTFFLALSELPSLFELELRGGWTRNEAPDTPTERTSLDQLRYLRIQGASTPLGSRQTMHRNPIRLLLQRFEAPCLHLAEVKCRTLQEGLQTLELFLKTDNLLVTSKTLENLTLHFLHSHSSVPNAMSIPYTRLLNIMPAIHDMTLEATKKQYSIHIRFKEREVSTPNPPLEKIKLLCLYYRDEHSLLDFIRACAPNYPPHGNVVHARNGWKVLTPAFRNELQDLGLTESTAGTSKSQIESEL